MTHLEPTRRTLLAAGTLLAVPTPLLAATPGNRRLVFSVLRNGERIGEHRMTFSGDEVSPTVSTEVAMTVKLGGVTVYSYRHTAREVWSDGGACWPQDPRLRRAVFAWHAGVGSGIWASGHVHGPQSVPRAELLAAISAAGSCARPLVIHSDCKYVVQGWSELLAG